MTAYADNEWPPRATGTMFKSDETPGAVKRHQRRKDAAQALEDAYAEVDIRDAGVCWVTGRTTRSKAADARVRREHHHLKGRNVKPEWVDKPERIITVCAEAHDLITQGWIVAEGVDARREIRFHWAAHVKPALRPFHIRSRRS